MRWAARLSAVLGSSGAGEVAGRRAVTVQRLGGLGLTSSIGLAVRLWRSRSGQGLSRRWPYLLGFIIVVYAAQVISGFVTHTQVSEAEAAVTFVYIMFGVGIARSWELLGLQGGGPLDLLAQRLGVDRPLASAPVAKPEESGPAPGAH